MQWLSQIAVRRPVFATVMILVFVVVGLVGYKTLGVDKFPKIDFPLVTIVRRTRAPRRSRSSRTSRRRSRRRSTRSPASTR